jgi:hypothetical protein
MAHGRARVNDVGRIRPQRLLGVDSLGPRPAQDATGGPPDGNDLPRLGNAGTGRIGGQMPPQSPGAWELSEAVNDPASWTVGWTREGGSAGARLRVAIRPAIIQPMRVVVRPVAPDVGDRAPTAHARRPGAPIHGRLLLGGSIRGHVLSALGGIAGNNSAGEAQGIEWMHSKISVCERRLWELPLLD